MTVVITYPVDAPVVNDGLSAQLRHMQQAVLALKKRQAGIVLTEELGTMESTGRAITYKPEELKQRIESFRNNYTRLPEVLKGQKLDQGTTDWFMEYVR